MDYQENNEKTYKIQRILKQLIPLTEECDMQSKHTAMLLSGGKPITVGYNHRRTCNANQLILSFHAEMMALNSYFCLNHEYGLRNFMNDSHFTLMSRKNESYLMQHTKNLNNQSPKCLRKKLEMVVIRVNNKGNLANSKPCNNCIYYLRLYGVKNVYYSNDNGVIVKEKINYIENEHCSLGHNRYCKYLENNDANFITFKSKIH